MSLVLVVQVKNISIAADELLKSHWVSLKKGNCAFPFLLSVDKSFIYKLMVTMTKRIHVAVAVIVIQGKVLLAQRPKHLHKGGYWEFPGGKVENNETIEDALVREIKEELGIVPVKFEPLIDVAYDYPEKNVLLDVWLVSDYLSVPEGREQQQIRWVEKSAIHTFQFPEANQPIVEKLLGEYTISKF